MASISDVVGSAVSTAVSGAKAAVSTVASDLKDIVSDVTSSVSTNSDTSSSSSSPFRDNPSVFSKDEYGQGVFRGSIAVTGRSYTDKAYIVSETKFWELLVSSFSEDHHESYVLHSTVSDAMAIHATGPEPVKVNIVGYFSSGTDLDSRMAFLRLYAEEYRPAVAYGLRSTDCIVYIRDTQFRLMITSVNVQENTLLEEFTQISINGLAYHYTVLDSSTWEPQYYGATSSAYVKLKTIASSSSNEKDNEVGVTGSTESSSVLSVLSNAIATSSASISSGSSNSTSSLSSTTSSSSNDPDGSLCMTPYTTWFSSSEEFTEIPIISVSSQVVGSGSISADSGDTQIYLDVFVQSLDFQLADTVMNNSYIGNCFNHIVFGKSPVLVNCTGYLADNSTTYGKKGLISAYKTKLRLTAMAYTGLIPKLTCKGLIISGPWVDLHIVETAQQEDTLSVIFTILVLAIRGNSYILSGSNKRSLTTSNSDPFATSSSSGSSYLSIAANQFYFDFTHGDDTTSTNSDSSVSSLATDSEVTVSK